MFIKLQLLEMLPIKNPKYKSPKIPSIKILKK
jgi:hypothetical protein